MRVLIIKMSSLGDILHTLPALTDAGKIIDDIKFDWVVEESFAEIPSWHPLVDSVIPIALRRWRKKPFYYLFSDQWLKFLKHLRTKKYHCIIDAQGLIKSSIIGYLAKGMRIGLDKKSLREPLARFFYQKYVTVLYSQHAIWRMRQIFAKALDYPDPSYQSIDYGLSLKFFNKDKLSLPPYVVLLHGTSRKKKEWPFDHWLVLAEKIATLGYRIKVPWGNQTEKYRASRLAHHVPQAVVLPKSSLFDIGSIMAGARAVVAVDTGFGHLATVLEVPTISLYGVTDPSHIGTQGACQYHLTPSNMKQDMSAISPESVWQLLLPLLLRS